VGNLIEEFMDLPPAAQTRRDIAGFEIDYDPVAEWQQQRDRLNQVLNEHGFQYFRGGRVFPTGDMPQPAPEVRQTISSAAEVQKPAAVEELLERLVRGLPRAMYPLANRRKGVASLSFDAEWDIQDLLHSQLRPWIADIRPEEFTPSYAGSSTRMDFLLPRYKLVLETKRVRDKAHGGRIGDELIIDIAHYRRHPDCDRLWCIVYDPSQAIQNPAGLTDLEGPHSTSDGAVQVRVFIFGG
jgi:hypothetical protein